MQKSYVVNGKFTVDRMQGIVRYAWEIVKALDGLLDDDLAITLLVPPNAKDVPLFQHIRVDSYGTHTGIQWEQTDLRKYLKTHPDSMCLNLCNVCPLFVQPGITTIHDIMYKVNPSHYKTLRNRVSRYWHMLQYSYIMKHESIILTTSLFTQREIERNYPKAQGKIQVVPASWQHVKSFRPNCHWRERYPFLVPGKFFFSLATRAKNKNGKWIIENARRYPQNVYAIAGKYYEDDTTDIPANVHLLGFISDDDACALMQNCRAFLFPSLYEGFGIPPLEALALGAKVISSDAASLPEVLGGVPSNSSLPWIIRAISKKCSPVNTVRRKPFWNGIAGSAQQRSCLRSCVWEADNSEDVHRQLISFKTAICRQRFTCAESGVSWG